MGKLMRLRLITALAFLPLFIFTQFAYSADDDVEEVVVTGSYIKTDREEIAVPVDVFDRGEYNNAGAPNMREVLRNMPAITGTINQSEQFSDGGGTIVGLKNVNIRSLGIPRTLVLFNGKRIVTSAGTTTEGNPFKVNGWGGSARAAYHLPATSGRITYSTVGTCTGFSGSNFSVN